MIQFQGQVLLHPSPYHREVLFEPISYGLPSRAHNAPSPVSGWDRRGKRLVDILVAITALVLFAIPMLLCALAIRLDSPGPVLFRQTRIGLNGHPFSLLKFRTMRDRGPEGSRWRQATRGDPRVTRVGHLLRCTSLDEMPQILNVLKGEMSIVGPRPHVPGTRAGGRVFEDVARFYHHRHQVRPGLTGLAQVRGWRGETDTEDKLLRRIECDLEYIATWSIGLDLRILWGTIFSVLRMRNAY